MIFGLINIYLKAKIGRCIMGENRIANIGPADLQSRINTVYQSGQSDAAAALAARDSVRGLPGQTMRREPVHETQPPAETKTSPLPVTNNDVVLKFRVDEKTQAVTVFVVDRASDSVLRTVPADELQKMSAGDLLKMAA